MGMSDDYELAARKAPPKCGSARRCSAPATEPGLDRAAAILRWTRRGNPNDAARRQMQITFIGGGNMARSLVGGLIARGSAPASIHVAEPFAPLREALARDFSVDVHAHNADAAERGAVWVFATKPQVLRSVAEALAPIAQRARPLVISIAAGISSTQLERWLGGNLAGGARHAEHPGVAGRGRDRTVCQCTGIC